MEKKEELLPCPFCGGGEHEHKDDCYLRILSLNRYGEETKEQWGMLKSGEAWNKRFIQ